MKELATTHNVTIAWRSFELRPAGSPPIPPEYRARIEAAQPRLDAIARDQYGVTLNRGPLGIDSRAALVGAKYAEAQGRGEAYHAGVFRAYWQEARRIDDRQVLGEVAAAAGLDPGAFAAALDDPRYQDAVDADEAAAHAYGLGSVPAHVFNQRYLVSGAQPHAALVQICDQLAQMGEG